MEWDVCLFNSNFDYIGFTSGLIYHQSTNHLGNLCLLKQVALLFVIQRQISQVVEFRWFVFFYTISFKETFKIELIFTSTFCGPIRDQCNISFGVILYCNVIVRKYRLQYIQICQRVLTKIK